MREIGWGTEVNLLYAIKRKVDKMVEPCCSITTTSTTTSSLCPEGAIYSGWMTVGNSEDVFGYSVGEGEIGSMNPSFPLIENGCGLIWQTDSLILVGDFNCNGDILVIIDNIEFTLIYVGNSQWHLENVLENPFAPVGELSSICILCGEELL